VKRWIFSGKLWNTNNKNIKQIKQQRKSVVNKIQTVFESIAYIKWFRRIPFLKAIQPHFKWTTALRVFCPTAGDWRKLAVQPRSRLRFFFRKGEERTKQWLLRWLTAKGRNPVDYAKVHKPRDSTVHKFRASLSAGSNVQFKHTHNYTHFVISKSLCILFFTSEIVFKFRLIS